MNAIYSFITKDGDSEGIAKYDEWLFTDPDATELEVLAAKPEWAEDSMASGFMTALAARGGQ